MFKKLFLLIALSAAMLFVPVTSQGVSLDQSPRYALLYQVTAIGIGSAKDFGFVSQMVTCHIVVGGTAPTSVDVQVLGSIDKTTYTNMMSSDHTYTIASPDTQTFTISGIQSQWYKGEYVSKVDGDGTTSVTFTCVSGGN